MDILKLFVICSTVFLLTLSVSSASDLNDTDAILQSDSGSFNELQNLIDESPENSILNLTKDYFSDNKDFPEGIVIKKPLTVNGNDHVIDANFNSRIFKISSSGVVLNNIKFVNGKTDSSGGAVYSRNGGTINNCIFENNFAKYWGGAVYQINGNVYNSTFINNSVPKGDVLGPKNLVLGYGSAIYQENSNVFNSTFIKNAGFDGGAIEQKSSGIYNSVFVNNWALDGGAVKQYDGSTIHKSVFIDNGYPDDDFLTAGYGGAVLQFRNSTVYDSIFIHNFASFGGAVNQREYSAVYNSTFVNNAADYGGAIFQEENSNVYDSSFVNNTAEHGGAIHRTDNSNVYNSTFENNHAKFGCNDICTDYHQNQSDNTDENDTDSYDDSGKYDGDSDNGQKIAELKSKDNTGNPLGLLALVFLVLITRIKK
ncbi:hypothetical protein [Methanobrevibacter sp.]